MKKLIPICLVASLAFTLTACQQAEIDSDTSKVQESVEKIKAKLQEDLSTDKSSKESQDKESDNKNKDTEDKDKNSDSKPNEPKDAD